MKPVMWEITQTVAFILLACCSLYGWGRLVRHTSEGGSWSLTLALGLALVIAMGGVLNLVRLAGVWPLTILAAIGLVLFLVPLARPSAWKPLTEGRWDVAGRLLMMGLALAALAFTVATQVPPAVYNFHDDFQKYFAHPVRMLETGTLYGSPLSALGSETLGGMAFLLGFVASHFPVAYFNGVDAAFSLFLCLLLVAGFAWRRPALIPAACLAMVSLFAINPQYVNVSALYTASALMLAAIFTTADPTERGDGPPSALAVGLLHTALIALKPTFLLFTVLHLVFTALAVRRGTSGGIKWGGAVAGWTALFLAPWIALHGAHYVAAFSDPVPGPAGDTAPLVFSLVDLFSTRKLFYGATLAHYSGLVIAVLLGAGAAFRHLGKGANDPRLRRSAAATLAAAGAGLVGYLLILHLGGPLLAGHGNALRLFIPVIIALVPAVLCLAALHLSHGESRYSALARGAPTVIAGLLIIAVLVPDLRTRLTQAVAQGTQFAVSRLAASARYRDYNRLKLHEGAGKRIRAIQQRIPAGEPIIAWINAPFHLDYRRNPIIDVDVAGLNTPWARSGNARYVLWEYRGYGVRTPRAYARQARRPGRQVRAIGLRGGAFMAFLRDQAGRGKFLFNDGAMAAFHLPAPLHWPRAAEGDKIR